MGHHSSGRSSNRTGTNFATSNIKIACPQKCRQAICMCCILLLLTRCEDRYVAFEANVLRVYRIEYHDRSIVSFDRTVGAFGG